MRLSRFFTHLHDLTEAPLADFGAYGDLDQEGSFRPDDLKALRNPKWLEHLTKSFSRTPYKFNIYAFNGKDGIVHFEHEWWKADLDVRNLQNLNKFAGIGPISRIESIINKKIPNASSSMNILLLENEGAERMPLTPWMLAHRVAHAVFYAGQDDVNFSDTNNKVSVERLNREYNNFLASAQTQLKELDPGKFASVRQEGSLSILKQVAQYFSPMRSARTGSFSNTGEHLVELVAQYIIEGKVTFLRPIIKGHEPFPELAPIDPKWQKLLDKALRIGHHHGDGEDFAKVVCSTQPRKPHAGYAAYGQDGKPYAAFQDAGRARQYEEKGYRVVFYQPSEADMVKFQKQLDTWKKKYYDTARMFNQWQQEGRLNPEDRISKSDHLHSWIGASETRINEAIKVMLDTCLGKGLIL